MLQRMIRAGYLDRGLYREVAGDRGATWQALLVIAVAAVATGIGSADDVGVARLSALPAEIVVGFVGWVVWASLTYLVGKRLMGAPTGDVGWVGLARAMGFAHTPGTLRVLAVLPGLGLLIPLVAAVWQFVAAVVAARETLRLWSLWRAVGAVAAGFIAYVFSVGLLRLSNSAIGGRAGPLTNLGYLLFDMIRVDRV